jgi:hypothetical protein
LAVLDKEGPTLPAARIAHDRFDWPRFNQLIAATPKMPTKVPRELERNLQVKLDDSWISGGAAYCIRRARRAIPAKSSRIKYVGINSLRVDPRLPIVAIENIEKLGREVDVDSLGDRKLLNERNIFVQEATRVDAL